MIVAYDGQLAGTHQHEQVKGFVGDRHVREDAHRIPLVGGQNDVQVFEDGRALQFLQLVILRRSQQHFELPVAFVGLQNERHFGAKRFLRGALYGNLSDRERQQVVSQANAGGKHD